MMFFIYFRIKTQSMNVGKILIIDIFTDRLYERFIGIEFYLVDRSYRVDIFDGLHVVRSNHLSAIAPICLITVVFLGVMAGCHHDTALTSEFADGI